MPPADTAATAAATGPAPARQSRARLVFAIKIVASVGLLAVLFHYADMSIVLARIAKADAALLFWSFVLLAGQTVISSMKWELILRSDGLQVPLPTLIRVNATSTFVSLFLPSSFGGDIYRVAALRAAAGGLVRSAASVLFDRGTGLFALVTISVISYQFYPRNPHAWAFIAGWYAIILAFVLATSERVLNSRLWPEFRVALKLRKLLSTLRVYRASGRVLLAVMGLALLFQFTMVVVNGLYSQALGIEIAFTTLLVIIPLIYLTEVIPVGINGIGIRDSAFVIAFATIGHTAEEGLAMSLLLISMRYLYGFTCGLVVLVLYFLRRRSDAG